MNICAIGNRISRHHLYKYNISIPFLNCHFEENYISCDFSNLEVRSAVVLYLSSPIANAIVGT